MDSAPSRVGEKLGPWRLATVIGSLSMGIFLFGLDTNIIGTAIPRITTDFGSLRDVSWYGAAYLLTLTAFQPVFGSLYRFFNAKVVYLVSLVVFEAGSAVTAAAPSSAVLIFGRAVLGLGAAGLLQGALAIISYIVSIDKVPLYQAIVISALGVSVCIGPVIGGLLTQYASWRWCFWINVPTGACMIILVFLFVPIQDPSSSQNINRSMSLGSKLAHLDAIGTLLFLGAVSCLLLVLTWGGSTAYPWKGSVCIGLYTGFGLLILMFCYRTWKRGDRTLIPLRVLRQRSICMGSLTVFGLGMCIQVYAYYLPIFFQAVQAVSTTESGVRYISLVIPQIVGIVVVGGIVTKWGYYVPFMIVGVAVACIGAGFLTTIDVSTPTAHWAAFMAITGIGLGISMNLPYTAVQAVLDTADVPIGNAIVVFSQQLGGAIGLAIAQNLLITKLNTAVSEYTAAVTPEQVIAAGPGSLSALASSPAVLDALRHAYRDSLRWTWYVALAASCVAFPPTWAMERLNIKRISEEKKHGASNRLEEEEGLQGVSVEHKTAHEDKVDLSIPKARAWPEELEHSPV